MNTSRELFSRFCMAHNKKYVWDRNESKQLKEVPRCNWIRRRQILAQLVWCRLVIGAMIQSNEHIQRMWNEKKYSRHCEGPWTEQERLKSAPTTCTWRQSIRLWPNLLLSSHLINYLTLCKFYADEARSFFKLSERARAEVAIVQGRWREKKLTFFIVETLSRGDFGIWKLVDDHALHFFFICHSVAVMNCGRGEMSRTDKCQSHPRPFAPRSLFWKLLYSTSFTFRVNGWVERDRKRK